MPSLQEKAAELRAKAAAKQNIPKKKYSSGIRPDDIVNSASRIRGTPSQSERLQADSSSESRAVGYSESPDSKMIGVDQYPVQTVGISGANTVQLECDSGAKPVQMGFKSGSYPVQTVGISGANTVQLECDSGAKPVQMGFKSGAERGAISGANGVHNLVLNSPSAPSLIHVVGIQRLILEFLFQSCIETGSKTTRPLSIKKISIAVNAPEETVKSSLHRLKVRDLITPGDHRPGRAGWTRFILPESVYQTLRVELNNSSLFSADSSDPNQARIKVQMGFKSGAERGAISGAEASSKLVSNNTNLLTVTREEEFLASHEPFLEFLADWGPVESHVSKLNVFGVTATQIGHLRNQKVKLYGYEITDLIDRLETYLRDPKTAQSISNKPGFFVSECRKKAADPNRSCFLDTVELPHEKAQREQAKAFMEEKRRLESAVAEIAVREETSELEAVVESNGGWAAVLDLVPHGMVPKGSGAHRALVRQYFRDLKRGEN